MISLSLMPSLDDIACALEMFALFLCDRKERWVTTRQYFTALFQTWGADKLNQALTDKQ